MTIFRFVGDVRARGGGEQRAADAGLLEIPHSTIYETGRKTKRWHKDVDDAVWRRREEWSCGEGNGLICSPRAIEPLFAAEWSVFWSRATKAP